MPGLLEGFGEFIKTPEGQGLLSAAFGGLAGAQRGAPLNSIGRAGLAGLTGYSGAIDRASQAKQQEQAQKFRDLQMSQTQMEMAQKQKEQELEGAISSHAQKFMQMPQAARQDTTGVDAILPEFMRTGGGMPAQPAKAGGFDSRGFLSTLPSVPGMNPLKAMEITAKYQPKETEFSTEPRFTPDGKSYLVGKDGSVKWLDGIKPRDKLEFVEGVGVNPYDAANTNRAIPNANKPFSMGADGKPIANTAFQNYEIQKAGAGASRTSVQVNNKMGESLAKEVAPMMRESALNADGAAKQMDAARRIITAVDSNKMYSGVGANIRMNAAQIGDTLGVTGKDTVEKIANTRQAMQGLAQLTLQGRAQMRGQGAITESESKLAERAISGDVTLTPVELRQLALAAQRSSEYVQKEHNRKLSVIQKTPELAGIAPFYEVQNQTPLEAAKPAKSVTGTGMYQGKKVIRYSDGSIEYAN